MQERLGFNAFRTEEATPTVWGVLGLKEALIKRLTPHCVHFPLSPSL